MKPYAQQEKGVARSSQLVECARHVAGYATALQDRGDRGGGGGVMITPSVHHQQPFCMLP